MNRIRREEEGGAHYEQNKSVALPDFCFNLRLLGEEVETYCGDRKDEKRLGTSPRGK